MAATLQTAPAGGAPSPTSLFTAVLRAEPEPEGAKPAAPKPAEKGRGARKDPGGAAQAGRPATFVIPAYAPPQDRKDRALFEMVYTVPRAAPAAGRVTLHFRQQQVLDGTYQLPAVEEGRTGWAQLNTATDDFVALLHLAGGARGPTVRKFVVQARKATVADLLPLFPQGAPPCREAAADGPQGLRERLLLV